MAEGDVAVDNEVDELLLPARCVKGSARISAVFGRKKLVIGLAAGVSSMAPFWSDRVMAR